MGNRFASTAAIIAALAGRADGQLFPAEYKLQSLRPDFGGVGAQGFVLTGVDPGDSSGRAVSSAGDINGDGIDDIIIGAEGGDPNGAMNAGECYVIFGGAGVGVGGELKPSQLNGANGFVIRGIDPGDSCGRSVSAAGDFNGDGIGDLIIGAPNADPNGRDAAGECYVIYGAPDIGASGAFDLSSLDGVSGFTFLGAGANDQTGRSVASAGDVNGDGFDDIIIGVPFADLNGRTNTGGSYVVFGGSNVAPTGAMGPALLNGVRGFVINGIDSSDNCGISVDSAGDINGDGFDDLIIGAFFGDPGGRNAAGESYLIFGAATVGAGGALDPSSLNGINGFVINGVDVHDHSGISVAGVGDFNGDGFDDLIIGAEGGDPNGMSSAGETFLLFGGATVGAGGVLELSSLNGVNGFVLNGIHALDYSSAVVSGAGDINGDGFSDIMIASYRTSPNGVSESGETYVVFGGPNVGAGGIFELSSRDGDNGFAATGIGAGDRSGRSISDAGDLNGDGIDDLIIGAYRADPNGQSNAGESYVIFGRTLSAPPPCPGDANGDTIVDFNDINAVIANWLAFYAPSTGPGDANNDGLVDFNDINAVLANWLAPCP